jgi:hypothetical protein
MALVGLVGSVWFSLVCFMLGYTKGHDMFMRDMLIFMEGMCACLMTMIDAVQAAMKMNG